MKEIICKTVGVFVLSLFVQQGKALVEVPDSTETKKESVELKEVVVGPKTNSTMSFRSSIQQSQKITYAELTRAACCNLSESFETNPSVDVAYSDAVTGAKQIRLLGLSGTYVQMMTENVPGFRGLAAPYGLDYVPGPWMESIQVSKGTSSVKNGYEAITGQINVEYKKPSTADVFTANVFGADNGRYELNADGSYMFNENLSSGLFVHYSSEQKQMDMNDDGFMDSPQKHQFNLMNRWYYRTENWISQLALKLINEERTGGQTDDALPAYSSVSLYRTNMEATRAEFFAKNGLIVNPEMNASVALILSGSYHDQRSSYGIRYFNAYETNLYASLIYETEFTKEHKISTGLSMNYDYFNETGVYNEINEATTGAYAEYTYNKDNKLIVLAGIRADYSSLYDFFVTPRLHVKYNLTDWMLLRGSIGKGFRTAHIMPENNFYMASNRQFVVADNLDQEEALNYGFNLGFYIPIAGKELTLNGEWYYTDFQHQVVADVDSDPHTVSFYNLDGKSYSSSFQVEATYPFFRGFTLTAAYRTIDAKTTYNGVLKKKPLTGDYKGLLTASYQTPLRKWQFDVTSQFNGGGRMPDPDPTNPLWGKEFDSYMMLNAQVTKYFRNWSVYIGAENLTDFTQERTVIGADDPWGQNFDATMIWGPVHGRKFYLGLRYNIPRM